MTLEVIKTTADKGLVELFTSLGSLELGNGTRLLKMLLNNVGTGPTRKALNQLISQIYTLEGDDLTLDGSINQDLKR